MCVGRITRGVCGERQAAATVAPSVPWGRAKSIAGEIVENGKWKENFPSDTFSFDVFAKSNILKFKKTYLNTFSKLHSDFDYNAGCTRCAYKYGELYHPMELCEPALFFNQMYYRDSVIFLTDTHLFMGNQVVCWEQVAPLVFYTGTRYINMNTFVDQVGRPFYMPGHTLFGNYVSFSDARMRPRMKSRFVAQNTKIYGRSPFDVCDQLYGRMCGVLVRDTLTKRLVNRLRDGMTFDVATYLRERNKRLKLQPSVIDADVEVTRSSEVTDVYVIEQISVPVVVPKPVVMEVLDEYTRAVSSSGEFVEDNFTETSTRICLDNLKIVDFDTGISTASTALVVYRPITQYCCCCRREFECCVTVNEYVYCAECSLSYDLSGDSDYGGSQDIVSDSVEECSDDSFTSVSGHDPDNRSHRCVICCYDHDCYCEGDVCTRYCRSGSHNYVNYDQYLGDLHYCGTCRVLHDCWCNGYCERVCYFRKLDLGVGVPTKTVYISEADVPKSKPVQGKPPDISPVKFDAREYEFLTGRTPGDLLFAEVHWDPHIRGCRVSIAGILVDLRTDGIGVEEIDNFKLTPIFDKYFNGTNRRVLMPDIRALRLLKNENNGLAKLGLACFHYVVYRYLSLVGVLESDLTFASEQFLRIKWEYVTHNTSNLQVLCPGLANEEMLFVLLATAFICNGMSAVTLLVLSRSQSLRDKVEALLYFENKRLRRKVSRHTLNKFMAFFMRQLGTILNHTHLRVS